MKKHQTRMKRWGVRALVFAATMIPIPFLSARALAATGCPFGKVDCAFPGECRRFIDADGGGFCDLAQLDPGMTTTPTTEAVAAGVDPSTTTSTVASPVLDGQVANVDSGGFSLFTHYFVSPIAIGFFLIYALSFFLYKTKRMKVATHRKIWNVLLLVTFLLTGIFGLILTIQLDYDLPFQMPIDLLFWHVEAGIVMTLISIFHIAWHFKYYARMLKTSRRKARGAEAAEGHAARRPVTERPVARPGAAGGHRPPTPLPERARALERPWEP